MVFAKTPSSTVTGIEMFRKILDEGQAGDNAGILLRGIKRDEVERGQVLCKQGTVSAYTSSIVKQLFWEKTKVVVKAFQRWISSSVLLPYY